MTERVLIGRSLDRTCAVYDGANILEMDAEDYADRFIAGQFVALAENIAAGRERRAREARIKELTEQLNELKEAGL